MIFDSAPQPGGSISMDSVVGQMGVLSALRTGNAAADLFMALMLPMAFKFLATTLAVVAPLVIEWFSFIWSKDKAWPTRTLTVERLMGAASYSDPTKSDDERRNNILGKALQLYISSSSVPNIDFGKEVDVSLMAVKEEAEVDDYRGSQSFGTTYSALCGYNITKLPKNGTWAKLNIDGLELKIETNSNVKDKDGDNERTAEKMSLFPMFTTVYTLRAPKESAIDSFLDRAYAWYKDEMKRKTTSDARYLFSLDKLPLTGEKESPMYCKYELSDDSKTFDTLFIPGKQQLLDLISDFQSKKGKFAIKGVANKLGLLLHGPPGTGKTSFIKALAHHTKRHVVMIPLSRLRTNRELQAMMFDLKFKVAGDDDVDIKYRFSDVIFVIEDVDAASSIVMQRTSDGPNHANPDGQGQDDTSSNASSGGIDAATLLTTMAMKASQSASGSTKNSKKKPCEGPDDNMLSTLLKSVGAKDDQINLAGLLNVIDGIVDTPGRILILSTNYPEKLDSALIRPGRVDRVLHLTHTKLPEAIEMIQHYFSIQASDIPQHVVDRLRVLFGREDFNITPAQMENHAVASSTVEEMLSKLEGIIAHVAA